MSEVVLFSNYPVVEHSDVVRCGQIQSDVVISHTAVEGQKCQHLPFLTTSVTHLRSFT